MIRGTASTAEQAQLRRELGQILGRMLFEDFKMRGYITADEDQLTDGPPAGLNRTGRHSTQSEAR